MRGILRQRCSRVQRQRAAYAGRARRLRAGMTAGEAGYTRLEVGQRVMLLRHTIHRIFRRVPL